MKNNATKFQNTKKKIEDDFNEGLCTKKKSFDFGAT